jgi:hypothetical protein
LAASSSSFFFASAASSFSRCSFYFFFRISFYFLLFSIMRFFWRLLVSLRFPNLDLTFGESISGSSSYIGLSSTCCWACCSLSRFSLSLFSFCFFLRISFYFLLFSIIRFF